MTYKAPLRDMLFAMNELAELQRVATLPGCEDAAEDTVNAVLTEAARFCGEVLAPLNALGDRQPPQWHGGQVSASPGFVDAFRQFVCGGWQGMQHPVTYGGQALPKLLVAPLLEMLFAANLSFGTCPSLTDGAIEALLTAAGDELKRVYVPKLVAGQWTGTMNLTEPQAGSDLALIRTRAEPRSDGSFRLFGTKIFITWGEHDMAENIVHLVLARETGAPEGVRGISLFLVPKFLVHADGTLGKRNDVHCVSIEHKLGIKASPTATLQFGDGDGAVGFLIGELGRGLEYMFVMMNAARFAVGMQGVGLCERAYQKAVSYARERVQSRPADGSVRHAVPIIQHPDVRRMLATMRVLTDASRSLAYLAAFHADMAHHHPESTVRAEHQAIYEFLVPIVKGWSTELATDVTSLGLQVHGGMGYIEETGAAQFYRDARILSIYEGTTAIQANDLLGRKTFKDRGAVANGLLAEMDVTLDALADVPDAAFQSMHKQLSHGRNAFSSALTFVLNYYAKDPNAVHLGAVPYLKLAGSVLGGWQMARTMLAAQLRLAEDPMYYGAKIAMAQFFAEHVLQPAAALVESMVSARGDRGLLALSSDQF